jgi:hypothetical protein
MKGRRGLNIEEMRDARKASPTVVDGLLRHRDAAKFLAVSESWLYASDIPFVRIGRSGRRYDLRELRDYVDRHKSNVGDFGHRRP